MEHKRLSSQASTKSWRSVHLSLPLSIFLSLCQSAPLSLCLSVRLSASLSVPLSACLSLLTVLANTCITCLSITVVLLIIVATLASFLLFLIPVSFPLCLPSLLSFDTHLHSNGTYARRLYCLCANCLALMCDICNLISAHNTSASLLLPRFVELAFTSCCHWQRDFVTGFYFFRLVQVCLSAGKVLGVE